MSTPTSRQRKDMTVLIRLRRPEALLLVGVFLGVNLVLVLANMHMLRSASPAFAALGLVVGCAAAMLAFRTDPLPTGIAVWIAATAPAAAGLVSWQLPSEGWPGYGAWHIGACTLLLAAMAVRGRIAWAWLGYLGLASVTVTWAVGNHEGGLGFAFLLLGTHTSTLTLASFLGVTLVRLARGIGDYGRQRVIRAVDEAATQARIDERDRRLGGVEARVRPLLEQIATGADLDEDTRTECLLLEAELRDSIRAPGLSATPVQDATRAARERGIEVVLLDDRTGPLPPHLADRVPDVVTRELNRAHDGTITVRLPPVGRASVATILADSSTGYRCIELDHTGDPVVVHDRIDAAPATDS